MILVSLPLVGIELVQHSRDFSQNHFRTKHLNHCAICPCRTNQSELLEFKNLMSPSILEILPSTILSTVFILAHIAFLGSFKFMKPPEEDQSDILFYLKKKYGDRAKVRSKVTHTPPSLSESSSLNFEFLTFLLFLYLLRHCHEFYSKKHSVRGLHNIVSKRMPCRAVASSHTALFPSINCLNFMSG